MPASQNAILVVDDDPDTCRNLADILTDLGYHVQTASNGFAALELTRHFQFDLAILDFRMPGMDGLTLYREIKRLAPEIVAIIVSAYTTSDTRTEAERAGTWKVLSKPLNLAQLLPLIDQAVHAPLVLVVDDDRELCANLWDLLHERGYRVRLAHTTAEARASVQQRAFDVVLLDLKLPEGTGNDVLATLRTSCPETRTIIITGHRLELGDLVRQALAEGADAVCYKPLDMEQMLGTLVRLATR